MYIIPDIIYIYVCYNNTSMFIHIPRYNNIIIIYLHYTHYLPIRLYTTDLILKNPKNVHLARSARCGGGGGGEIVIWFSTNEGEIFGRQKPSDESSFPVSPRRSDRERERRVQRPRCSL